MGAEPQPGVKVESQQPVKDVEAPPVNVETREGRTPSSIRRWVFTAIAAILCTGIGAGIAWETAKRREHDRFATLLAGREYTNAPHPVIFVRLRIRQEAGAIIGDLENPNLRIDDSGMLRPAKLEFIGNAEPVGGGALQAPAVISATDAQGRSVIYELERAPIAQVEAGQVILWESSARLREPRAQ